MRIRRLRWFVTRMRNAGSPGPQLQVTTPGIIHAAGDVGILDRKSLHLGVLERERDAFRSCCNSVRCERQWWV